MNYHSLHPDQAKVFALIVIALFVLIVVAQKEIHGYPYPM